MSNSELVKQMLKVILSNLFGGLVSKKTPSEKARLGPSYAKSEQKVMVLSLIISTVLGILWLASTMVSANPTSEKITSEYKELYESSITRLEKFTEETSKLLKVNSSLATQIEQRNHELKVANERVAQMDVTTKRLEKEIDNVTDRYFALMVELTEVRSTLHATETALDNEIKKANTREAEFLRKEAEYRKIIESKEISAPTTIAVKAAVQQPEFTLSDRGRSKLINRIKKSSEVRFQ